MVLYKCAIIIIIIIVNIFEGEISWFASSHLENGPRHRYDKVEEG